MLKMFDTSEPTEKPSLVMLVYGEGGVGKSTFASTSPSPFLADCEGGTKYFGLRNIAMRGARITKWEDFREFCKHVIATEEIQTVVIDPIGELMEFLKQEMIAKSDKKLVQGDGSPTAAGWGWLKDTMRTVMKTLRNSGKHVIVIGHVEPEKDEDRIVKSPLVQTKFKQELVNMVDVVGYFTTTTTVEGETKRVILVEPGNDKYVAKDRTGQLGKVIPPDFKLILNATQGTENYAWSKPAETKPVVAEIIEPVAEQAEAKTEEKAKSVNSRAKKMAE